MNNKLTEIAVTIPTYEHILFNSWETCTKQLKRKISTTVTNILHSWEMCLNSVGHFFQQM